MAEEEPLLLSLNVFNYLIYLFYERKFAFRFSDLLIFSWWLSSLHLAHRSRFENQYCIFIWNKPLFIKDFSIPILYAKIIMERNKFTRTRHSTIWESVWDLLETFVAIIIIEFFNSSIVLKKIATESWNLWSRIKECDFKSL